MLFAFAGILLILAAVYQYLELRVQRQERAQSPAPRAMYTCRQCGQPVDMAATFRPIRLTLLCPAHYHAQYAALRPLPGPRKRRDGHDAGEDRHPVITILPRR
jgi:hypothetical protein